jgi:hypothetical protein
MWCHRLGQNCLSYPHRTKLAPYVNVSGSCENVDFFDIRESGVPWDSNFNSDHLVELKLYGNVSCPCDTFRTCSGYILFQQSKCRFAPVHDWRRVGVVGKRPLIRKLGTSWRWVIILTPRPLYLRQETPVPIELAWPLPVWRIESRIVQRVIWSQYQLLFLGYY